MWRWWQRRRFRARMRRDEAAIARTAAVVAAPEVEGWNAPTRWLVPVDRPLMTRAAQWRADWARRRTTWM